MSDHLPDEVNSADAKEMLDVQRWQIELKIAEKDKSYDLFCKRAKSAIKRYKDERTPSESSSARALVQKRFNILCSNIQTLGPVLYSRVPKPVVDRRKRNRDDQARTAAEILERALDFDAQSYDFDHVLVNVRDEYLLTGFGQVWVESKTEYGEPEVDPATGEEFRPIKQEKVVANHVHWSDFRCNPARTWDEVRWVAKRVYMSKDQLKAEFGEEKCESVDFSFIPEGLDEDRALAREQDEYKKAVVWEIWDKHTKRVMHIAKGCEKFLRNVPDPLGLEGFFPCPRPLIGLHTTDSIWPMPDYHLYEDQARQLDELTQREFLLTEALRVVGIYDASNEALKRLLSEAGENEMIPVEDWAGIAGKGGIDGSVDFLPLGEIITTLNGIREAKQGAMSEVYELTGLSDIVRGNSAPSETATAQQIKGQFATLRISDRQRAIQRFARDILAIKAEIIAEHFQPDTFAQIMGVDLNDPGYGPYFGAALALLKDEKLRTFRIDIETDSTIAINEEQDKQSRTEFLTAVGPFMQQASQVLQTDPTWGPVFAEMLMFTVRAYKVSRTLEASIQGAIDSAIQAAQQAAQQPPQEPPPDPAMIEMQNKLQLEQMKLQLEQQKHADNMGIQQQKINFEAQLKQMEQQLEAQRMQYELAIEREKLNGNLALQAEKVRADMAMKAYEAPQMEQERTLEALEKEPAQPIMPPIIVNVDAKQATKKVAKVQRAPDGSLVGEVVDVPDVGV